MKKKLLSVSYPSACLSAPRKWGVSALACVLVSFGLALHQAMADPPTADRILSEIHQIGPAAELKALAHAPGYRPGDTQYDSVLDAVQGGSQPWLDVAAHIYPATDGGLHYALLTAVTMAIQKNPTGVLQRAEKPFRLTDVCMQRLIEPTPAQSQAFLKATRAALAGVHDPRLRPERDACLKLLS